jgi:pyruvate/2-oxoglutarate dehydrogenase complex dihydrolipoamide acyltransferase (E2) component
LTDLIGKYDEKPFPKIQNSVGDVFEFSRSKYYVLGLVEADVTVAIEIIEQQKLKTGESFSFTGWIAKCLAQTITEYPEANSFRKGRNRVITFRDVDVVIVVEKMVEENKYPVPYVIRKVNEKKLVEVHTEIRNAQAGIFSDEQKAIDEEKERDRKSLFMRIVNPYSLPRFIRMIYWRGFRTDPFKVKRVMGTTGITAVGMFGKSGGWPISVGTHTVDLAVGGITRKPGVVGNAIEIRKYLQFSIYFDHEIIDGAPAARFTSKLVELMENAYSLTFS